MNLNLRPENECKFDCLFEQVKPKDFDYLLFGIFFRDQLVIFFSEKFRYL